MSKGLVIIPTYNERDNITRLIERLLPIDKDLDILVVDDNSPDRTADEVDCLAKGTSRIHIIRRQKKAGLGTAYLEGFKFALKHGYDPVITMDADLSHRPRYIPSFLEKIKDYDLVAGCRWMEGGGIGNWPLNRLLQSRLANIYARTVLGVKFNDLTGGYNCYRRNVLSHIALDKIHSDGYSFQIEMKYRAFKNDFRCMEIPIYFRDRKEGASKISKRIIFEAFFIVWKLRWGLSKK